MMYFVRPPQYPSHVILRDCAPRMYLDGLSFKWLAVLGVTLCFFSSNGINFQSLLNFVPDSFPLGIVDVTDACGVIQKSSAACDSCILK